MREVRWVVWGLMACVRSAVVSNEHALLIWMSAVRHEMSMCLLVWNKSLRFLCVHSFVTGLCVCVERGRERECSLDWNGSLPFMNIQLPPTFHWCLTDVSLRVGKWVAPVTVLPQSCFYCCKKKNERKKEEETGTCTEVQPQNATRAGLEPATKYGWVKCSWSHVALFKTRAALRSHV